MTKSDRAQSSFLALAPLLAVFLGADGPEASNRAAYDPQAASKTVVFWEAQAKRDPEGFIEWRELARALLARQRETGEIADAVKAEKAARQSLKISSKRNSAALSSLGRSLLAQHRFPEALQIATLASKLDPSASRLVADVQMELGDYDAAERALAVDPPKEGDLNYLALLARVDDINGRARAALRHLREACETVDERPDMPAETVAWAHTMLGHALVDTGRLDEGEKCCLKALSVFPADYRAMTGLAEAATWRRDWKAAANWARKAIDTCPQNPEALRLLAEAEAKLGHFSESMTQSGRLKELCHSFPRIYDRHWVLFCADEGRDLDEALELARKDLELRKDVFAYDALAWVSFKKGLLAEAERAMAQAMSRGTQSAHLYFHAGMIARASGHNDRADAFIANAKSLNPSLIEAAKLD